MAEPLPVSVLLLARDETRDLEELLPALGFAREIVVVWDPRGDRATRAAAQRLGARVFERAFDGFGRQRQFALAQCTQDWVLWIDADERLRPESLPALAEMTRRDPAVPAQLKFRRRTFFLGRPIRWCGWGGEEVCRFFTRRGASFDDAPVHERVRPEGDTRSRDFTPPVLEHHSYRTIDDCVAKMRRYASANAAKSWDAGRRAGVLDVALRPPLRFVRQYLLQLGFLDGAHGLVLCAFSAAQVFLKYAELWDRTRRERRDR
jgi:(heptosyl)LPS beta-1,4-glucosyltransferase